MLTRILFACLLLPVACLAFGQEYFTPYGPQPYLPVGDGPNAIVSGQFMGDGATDLAIVNVGDGTLQILAKAGIAFYMAQTVETSWEPRFIAAGDFNLGGVMEIVSSNTSSDNISVFECSDEGWFFLAGDHEVGEAPWDLAVDLLNADPYPDLAVANGWDTTITVYFGSPDGLSGTGTFPCGYGPGTVLPADFDADGEVELAVLREDDGLLTYMENDGDGNFSITASYSVGEVGYDLKGGAVADLDGDLDLDLALVTNSIPVDTPDFVTVMLNNGLGTFTEQGTHDTLSTPTAIIALDFTGDEVPDLAVTGFDAGAVDFFLGSGGAQFYHLASFPVGTGARDAVAVDLEDDGDPDLAVALRGSDRIAFLENLMGGNTAAEPAAAAGALRLEAAPNPFNPSTEIRYGIPAGPANLAVFDAAGRKVRTLLAGPVNSDAGILVWDGCDDRGGPLPSGVYILRLEAGGAVAGRKAVLLK